MSADVLHVQINGHEQPLKSWCTDMKYDLYTKKEGIDLMKCVASAHDARVSVSGMNNELNRLATFKDWPENCPMNPSHLARAGFYYTGVRDAVKCFSCGGVVERWEFGDTAMGEHKRHYPKCAFASQKITANVSLLEINERPEVAKKLGSKIEQSQRDIERRAKEKEAMLERVEPSEPKRDLVRSSASSSSSAAKDEKMEEEEEGPSMFGKYNQEHVRLQSFKNWPRTSPIEPRDLAKAGFYYINYNDSVQCFACFGQISRWKPCDVPAVEHKTHFPNCPYVQGLDVGNLPISTPSVMHAGMLALIRSYSTPMPTQDQLRAGQFLKQQRSLRAQIGTWNNCKHPNFVQEDARLGAFRNWPGNPGLHVTPQILAKAGFYFTGLVDECKCFYCDGDLKNWEPTDEPWTEHAKWFPRCEWLIQQRGQAFIDHIQQVNPPPISTPPLHFTAPNLGAGGLYSQVEPPYRFQASYQERPSQASSKPSPPLNRSKKEIVEEKASAIQEYESRHKEPEGAAAINFRPKPKKLETTEPSNAISSIDDFMQSPSAQTAVEMGYHTELIRYVVTQHFKKTSRQFSHLEELLDSIWEAQGQGIDPTPSVGKASGGHDVDYLRKLPKELESESLSATSSNIIDIQPLHFTAPNLGAEEPYSHVEPPFRFQASYEERPHQASSKPSPPLSKSKKEMRIEEEKASALQGYESRHKEPEVAAAINFRPKPKKLEKTEPSALKSKLEDEPSSATSSVNDFMQSPSAQTAVEMGYHTELIRYVVTQHFKKTGRQFSHLEELLDSIWEAQGQGIDPTPSVGEASGGHDVDYLGKLPKELESESSSARSSNIIDIQAEKLARLSISDEPRQRMNSSPRTVTPVTPIGSLKPQTLVSSGSSDPSYQDKQLCKISLEKELN